MYVYKLNIVSNCIGFSFYTKNTRCALWLDGTETAGAKPAGFDYYQGANWETDYTINLASGHSGWECYVLEHTQPTSCSHGSLVFHRPF